MYSAATDPADQSNMLGRFKGDGNLSVIVATIAFRMGKDIPGVKVVVH